MYDINKIDDIDKLKSIGYDNFAIVNNCENDIRAAKKNIEIINARIIEIKKKNQEESDKESEE